jgi:hypothetical protein
MHTHFYEIYMEGTTPLEVPRPEKLPVEGDILIVEKDFRTPSNAIYLQGDEIHLVKRTNDAPFGKLSSLGNWQAITKLGVSIWSNIEWALAEGTFSIRKTPGKGRHARK